MTQRPSYESKLADILEEPPISIEILPGKLEDWTDNALPPGSIQPSTEFPFVYTEGNLGIPKHVLYRLYLAAVPRFKVHGEHAKVLSAILILANPAHQTALNHRKKLMETGILTATREIYFIDLLVRGSRLAAKESAIWAHRRWTFQICWGVIGTIELHKFIAVEGWAVLKEAELLPRLSLDLLREEFGLVRQACTSYPRNYHAWTHWHFLMDVAYAHLHLSNDSYVAYLTVMQDEFSNLRNWVDRNISDYTAIHHLCNLARLFDQLAPSGSPSGVASGSLPLLDHAFSLVKLYPSYESLWMYLRLVTDGLRENQRNQLWEETQRLLHNRLATVLNKRSNGTQNITGI